jgi:molybdopterin synthase sulfur carrier subunit
MERRVWTDTLDEHMTSMGRDPVVTLRYFAAAREAAGTGRETAVGGSVAEVLADATSRHGTHFAGVLDTCKVWVNGEPAAFDSPLDEGDEVAVLPPVSGGCGW